MAGRVSGRAGQWQGGSVAGDLAPLVCVLHRGVASPVACCMRVLACVSHAQGRRKRAEQLPLLANVSLQVGGRYMVSSRDSLSSSSHAQLEAAVAEAAQAALLAQGAYVLVSLLAVGLRTPATPLALVVLHR